MTPRQILKTLAERLSKRQNTQKSGPEPPIALLPVSHQTPPIVGADVHSSILKTRLVDVWRCVAWLGVGVILCLPAPTDLEAAWVIPGANPCVQWREVRTLQSVARRTAPPKTLSDPRVAVNQAIAQSLGQLESERTRTLQEDLTRYALWEEHYRAECANQIRNRQQARTHSPAQDQPLQSAASQPALHPAGNRLPFSTKSR